MNDETFLQPQETENSDIVATPAEELEPLSEDAAPVEGSDEAPLEPEQDKRGFFVHTAFDFLEMFAWSIFAVLILFTFCFRICSVKGSSMERTLSDGDALLLSEAFYTPKQDDIIVFHLTDDTASSERTLVKRVIATEGQKLRIDFNTGEITVDGEVYNDSHKVLMDFYGHDLDYYTPLAVADHHYSTETRIFEATIPEGHLFVMGDNRNNSKDSRKVEIGFVDERAVLGKVIIRLFPFTILN